MEGQTKAHNFRINYGKELRAQPTSARMAGQEFYQLIISVRYTPARCAWANRCISQVINIHGEIKP